MKLLKSIQKLHQELCATKTNR